MLLKRAQGGRVYHAHGYRGSWPITAENAPQWEPEVSASQILVRQNWKVPGIAPHLQLAPGAYSSHHFLRQHHHLEIRVLCRTHEGHFLSKVSHFPFSPSAPRPLALLPSPALFCFCSTPPPVTLRFSLPFIKTRAITWAYPDNPGTAPTSKPMAISLLPWRHGHLWQSSF